MTRSPEHEALDLGTLPPGLRDTFTKLLSGERVTVMENGAVLGSLDFTPRALEGSLILPDADPERSSAPPRSDARVVATTMPLSETARTRLSSGLGDGYIVLDVTDAPASADVVLTHPVSPQLLAKLRSDFPAARIIVTEIDDEEAGVSYSGPVSRALDAGASAYLPPRPLEHVAQNVRTHLEHEGHHTLNAPVRATPPALGRPEA